MSKAFTKDDGPTTVEVQRHRLALPTGSPNYVTPSGLAALCEELTRFEADSTKHGPTWRAELEERIATAVVPPPPIDRSEIRFGARVRLRAHNRDRQVQIVGMDEANPSKDSIAFVSPLARAILGRRVGDVVTVGTPGGEEELEVLAVDYDEAR